MFRVRGPLPGAMQRERPCQPPKLSGRFRARFGRRGEL